MLLIELLTSLFLIWLGLVPFQNYQEMSHFWLAGFALWIGAVLLWRSKRLFSTSLLFHLTLIIAYSLRADFAEGWLHRWLFWGALVQWCVVLWLAVKRPDNRSAPSLFLIISFVSPLLFAVLNVTDRTYPGFALVSLLVLRIAWLNRDSISIPWPLLLFLGVCLLSIPFSYYYWHNVQFLILNCVCVLLYACSRYRENRDALLLGYLHLSLMIIGYALFREIYSFWQIGSSVFRMRLAIFAHHDDLVPLFIILSCLLFGFAMDLPKGSLKNRPLRIVLLASAGVLAVLNFLTYSRNGWLDYGVFVLIAGMLILPRKKFVALAAVGVVALVLVIAASPDIRQMAAKRVTTQNPSFDSRAFDAKIGFKTIRDHPLFGIGWLNFYAHTAQIKSQPVLQDVGKALVVPIQSHSVLILMCESGGVFLGILFFLFLVIRLDFRNAAIFSAGLAAVILNCLLDSACFWLPVYIHLWILCGIIGSHTPAGPAEKKAWVPMALAGLFALSFVFPSLEDRFLYESTFYLNNNQTETALLRNKWARWSAPLDVEPLQLLKEIYLSRMDEQNARHVLNRLIQFKKDFAPYYSSLASLELHDGNRDACLRYVRIAQEMDPQGAFGVSTYLTLAALERANGDIHGSDNHLSTALLLRQSGGPVLEALPLLEGINQDRFLQTAVKFARINAPTEDDWSAAVLNLYYNLMSIQKEGLAAELIPSILANRENMYPEDVDDFCLYLANLYAGWGGIEEMRPLVAYCTKKGALRITARIQLMEQKFPEAERTLRDLLQYYDYPTLRWGFEALYIGTQNREDMRVMFRILQMLPSEDADASLQERIAVSCAEDHDLRKAADEYHELSYYSYWDPTPHWREAHFWWLAGEEGKAGRANEAMLRLIPQNTVYANLYRSDITALVWQAVCVRRASIPNDLGGQSYRTGMFIHPPATVVLPPEVQLKTIQGELGILGNAWAKETDGTTFSICSSDSDCVFNRTINAKDNPHERFWNAFSWEATQPTRVVLKSEYGINNKYDWLFLVVTRTE